jgi:hypothetical protein
MAHAQKPDFVFRRNARVYLNRQERQFSRQLAAEVCASAVVILDTPCSEIMWRVLNTHSIRQFPLRFPPSPWVTVCHHVSTGLYLLFKLLLSRTTQLIEEKHIRARSTIRNRSFVSTVIAESIVRYTLTVRAFYGLKFGFFFKEGKCNDTINAIPKLVWGNKEKHKILYRNSMFYGCLISEALEYEPEKLTATFNFKL